jgi:hypothetical protein
MMRHLVVLVLALLLAPILLHAQSVRRAGTLSALGSVTIDVSEMGQASVDLRGTFTATVSFEVSADEGTYVAVSCFTPAAPRTAVTSATAAGLWSCPVGGMRTFRARVSSYTSGSVVVTLSASAGGMSTIAANDTDVPGDWTVGDQLIVSGAGPHAIGGVTYAAAQLAVRGTFTPAPGDDGIGTIFNNTINVPVGERGLGTVYNGILVEGASGNHPLLAGLYVSPTEVTAGVATVTDTATVYVFGAGSATVSGENKALWVDSGRTDLDGTVFVSGISAGAAGDTDACLNATTNELTDAGASTCIVSSLRFKSNWQPLTTGLAEVLRLTPGSFHYTNDLTKRERIGLTAENMQLVEPRLAFYEPDGVTPRGVAYEETVALLVKAIQELEARVRTLEGR